MSAHAETPAPKAEKKKMSKKKMFVIVGVIGGGLIALLSITFYRGDWRHYPTEAMATNRMHQRIVNEFESQADEIDGTPNFTEAARKLADLKVESSHKRNLVDNFHRNCPETDGWKGNTKQIDLTGCDSGRMIWLQMPNNYAETTVAISLYKIGEDGKLIQVAIKPVIEVINPKDGFSKVKEISPEGSVSPVDYKVRGDIKFITLGADADVLVLELKK